VILISNLILYIEDGSTVASTEIYGADKKTYINIGSGNVFKLHWETPSLANEDTVDHYNLVIKRHDTTLNVYYDIFDQNIGLVKEFFVDSYMLPSAPEQYMLSVYLVAYSKQGSIITSNVINPYISKGSGTYVKVKEGYMKRAIAFVKASPVSAVSAVNEQDGLVLLDSNGDDLITSDGYTLAAANPKDIAVIKNSSGDEVLILDEDGNQVQLLATRLLTSPNWQLVLESSVKAPDNTWRTTDIKHEVLVDETGEIIVSDNEPIYVL